MAEEEQLPVLPQNFSIMEPFDKQSKMTDQETGDDYTQDSFVEKFFNGEQDPKNKKYSKKQIMDTNTIQLKREFEEIMKKEEMDNTKVQNEAELKKLLNDARVYTKERNKRLEFTYTQFEKLIEEDSGSQSKKPTMKNFSTKGLQYPQVLDNRNAHKLEVTGMPSTEENITYLQSQLYKISEQSENLQLKIIQESEKTLSLSNMQTELAKSVQIHQEEINGHDEIIDSFEKQVQQADEKQRRYLNDVHATQVQIQKFQRFIRADSQQKSGLITDKNKSIDEQKHDLKDTIAEYKKLQNEMDRAKAENFRKLEEIKEVNKKLRTKFELMLESRKLLKELDVFDKLTKIFIYGEPQNFDLAELENEMQNGKTQQDPQEDDQDLTSYLQSDQNNVPSPTYKQGTIITRLRRFYKFHGEDLNSIVEQILKTYGEYNMQNHTLQRRLDDLQEQKRKLGIIWNELLHQESQEDKSQRQPQYEDNEYPNELESPLKKRTNKEIIQSKKLQKNRVSQDDINDLQQFIGHCFLFLNESLFRMVGITSLVRGISNTQDQIKKDEKFQEEYFKNELFDNLQYLISYSVTNKGLLMSGKQQSEDSTSNVEVSLSNQLSTKIIDISRSFMKNLPEIADKQQIFTEIVKKDFVLLNFCQLDTYKRFFEYLRNKIDSAQSSHTADEIWNQMETKVREEGRGVFTKMLNKLLTYLKQLLQRVQNQKDKIYQKLLELNPDSPAFKPSHIRKKLEDKKVKKKDWKDKLVKNKIKEYENYKGITVEQEQQAGGLVQYINDLVSQSEGGQQKSEYEHEDEKRHIDQIWNKEKGDIVKKAKEQKEFQNKVQEKPKVNSKYLEQNKYGLKYTESQKFLVKSKKEFTNSIWDAEAGCFTDAKTLRTQLPRLNDNKYSDKPEHLFSHVMYQSTHPNLESKFFNNNNYGLKMSTLNDQDITQMRKSERQPFASSQAQLANMRKLSTQRTDSQKQSVPYKYRSKTQVSNSNSIVISKSRLLDARDESKIMQIKTNSNVRGYNKPTRIRTDSVQLEPIKQNSQMI